METNRSHQNHRFVCSFDDLDIGDVVDTPPVVQVARARTGDPDTSHEAAASVRDLTGSQDAVLSVLEWHGPIADNDLVRRYQLATETDNTLRPLSESGIRSRRAELVRLGRVVHVGYTTLDSGRRARVWGVA